MNIRAKLRQLFFPERPLHERIDTFWVQKVAKHSVQDRFLFFENACRNKKVIHFGCNDYPIFNPSYNLHIHLSKHTEVLHGFDIDLEGIEELRKYVDQEYFSQFSELEGRTYDICLVPETIEHVDNVRSFLEGIASVDATTFYITAPNCFAQKHMKRNHETTDQFIEIVHPDHNYWFSPYTLKNVIQKYTNLEVTEVILLENDTMVCCKAIKK
ncbi:MULTISPECIES: hypothetical protein [unclassified Flavobacterium]|uniref:hypothetical protein n=1 Tax=unclassified Flavobacterium TaxID=196869 RepID=UPI001F137551|nr:MULTISPECIES: hypothetical protein [unclassified Flavobacterium]UMY65866.1 hypothetical protein MKO97_00375 [Flavobacterium sp. HJ-32-4]